MDLNSHHGTTVTRANGAGVVQLVPSTRHRLEHGDIVTFGKTVVKDNVVSNLPPCMPMPVGVWRRYCHATAVPPRALISYIRAH